MSAALESAPRFGLIAEGPIDFVVLRYILAGCLDNPDVIVNELQPLTTGPLQTAPGWFEVLRFCGSDRFREAFQFNDYLVVQIDTDACEEVHFDVSRRGSDGNELNPEQFLDAVRAKLIAVIGGDVYSQKKDRILFAICVDTIECWLLPLYYDDNRANKKANCLRSLNEQLQRRENFGIDPDNKHVRYYRRIAKPYAKPKDLLQKGLKNASLRVFLDEVKAKVTET